MPDELKYQECFIAFFDILGFSEKVKFAEDDPIEISVLLHSLNICSSISSGNKKITNDSGRRRTIKIQGRYFSDSMVFFLEEDPKNIGHLFLIIRYIQDNLWKAGFVLRGAITKGRMYIPNSKKESNITLGPGIIDAVYLESKIAIYPRIIISDNLLEYIRNNNINAYPFAENGYLVDYLRQDNDGIYFLDLLNRNIIRKTSERLEKKGNNFSIEWYSDDNGNHDEIMTSVSRCINNSINHKDESVRQKYKWLKIYKDNAV